MKIFFSILLSFFIVLWFSSVFRTFIFAACDEYMYFSYCWSEDYYYCSNEGDYEFCPADKKKLWVNVRVCPYEACIENITLLETWYMCCDDAGYVCNSCGGGGCFAGETPISVKGNDGSLQSVPISQLKEGDKVVSQSTQSGEMTESTVEKLHQLTREGYYEVTVENPDGTEKTIKVTGEHPLFVKAADAAEATGVTKVLGKVEEFFKGVWGALKQKLAR